MKYHKQLLKHSPEHGMYGDCHRTAIACIFDLEPTDVPNFGEHFNDVKAFDNAVQSWLAGRGLVQLTFAYQSDNGIHGVMRAMTCYNPGVAYIMGVQSPGGTAHSIVVVDGVIHDPAYYSGGTVEELYKAIPDEDTGGAYFWVSYIGALLAKQ